MLSDYDPHDAFIATYASRTGVFFSTYLPLLILMGAIPAILLREDVMEFIREEEGASEYMLMVAIFGGLFLLVVIESAVGLIRIGAGKPALIIDRNGIRGRHAYLTRNFAWSDVGEIFTKTGRIYVARKPKNILERITQSYTRPGGRYRFETFIMIPLENIDKSVTDINFAIQRYAPDNSRFAEPSWTIPKEPFFHTGRLRSPARE